MTNTTQSVDTSAELLENDILPKIKEVHTDPNAPDATKLDMPKAMAEPVVQKSPAQWAYERIILYIQNFEKQLDNDHEVGIGLTGGEAGVIKIEGLGYFDPDIITYYGVNQAGVRTQLIQHVTQMNVTLVASPKQASDAEAQRIGFRLAEELERNGDVTT